MSEKWNAVDRRRVLGALGAAGAALAGSVSTTAARGESHPGRGRGRSRGSNSGRDVTDSSLVLEGVDRVTSTFDQQLAQELHHGGQLAVYHDGEFVVDTAGGVTGPDGGETTTETRHVLFSCTKPYAAACVHLLADRGELAYDDLVIEHWPDYADEGTAKAGTTIRQVLSHQAGLPTVDGLDDNPALWHDPDAIARAVEDAETLYPPGATAQYHILSFGWLTGELVRQVTGRRIDEFAREELFEPLGMDDTSIGLPAGEQVDVATLVGFEPYDRITPPENPASNAETAGQFNNPFVQQAIVPGANGIGTASDMARFYACLLNGGTLEGTRLFSPSTIEEWTSLHAETELDPVREAPGRFSMGFFLGGLAQDSYGVTAPPSTFGHGGLGSSMAWADPENDIAFAYITNGIRDSDEHSARVGTMADTVRHELADKHPSDRKPGRGPQ